MSKAKIILHGDGKISSFCVCGMEWYYNTININMPSTGILKCTKIGQNSNSALKKFSFNRINEIEVKNNHILEINSTKHIPLLKVKTGGVINFENQYNFDNNEFSSIFIGANSTMSFKGKKMKFGTCTFESQSNFNFMHCNYVVNLTMPILAKPITLKCLEKLLIVCDFISQKNFSCKNLIFLLGNIDIIKYYLANKKVADMILMQLGVDIKSFEDHIDNKLIGLASTYKAYDTSIDNVQFSLNNSIDTNDKNVEEMCIVKTLGSTYDYDFDDNQF